MAEKRRRPGSPKGQLKPLKRQLDEGFPGRLRAAFKNRPGFDVPLLAKKIGCTRAVLLKYLAGKSKTIEALLLFAIANELQVSAAWLLKNAGAMAKAESLTPEQSMVLNIYSQLGDELKNHWMAQGQDLVDRQPALMPTTGRPYVKPVPGRSHRFTVHEPEPSMGTKK